MDRHIRKFVLGEARRLPERKKELEFLKEMVVHSSPRPPDGQPRGKGQVSDPTASKVIKLERINDRIKAVEEELKVFQEFKENIKNENYLDIYTNTILRNGNIEFNAMEVGYSWQHIFKIRAKMLDEIAERLGCYLDTTKYE